MGFYRKKTNLEGIYKTLAGPHLSGKMLVVEVSADGCLFSASASHRLKQDDQLGIAFTLNDSRSSMIRKKAIVQKIDGRFVDCQFLTLPGSYDPDLGFYLRAV